MKDGYIKEGGMQFDGQDEGFVLETKVAVVELGRGLRVQGVRGVLALPPEKRPRSRNVTCHILTPSHARVCPSPHLECARVQSHRFRVRIFIL